MFNLNNNLNKTNFRIYLNKQNFSFNKGKAVLGFSDLYLIF